MEAQIGPGVRVASEGSDGTESQEASVQITSDTSSLKGLLFSTAIKPTLRAWHREGVKLAGRDCTSQLIEDAYVYEYQAASYLLAEACVLKYKRRYKKDSGDSNWLDDYDFALVASVGVDLLKAAPQHQRWAMVELFLADVMTTLAAELKRRAEEGCLEEDELVKEVIDFYGACMERERVDRDHLLAVLSEWASLLPLTIKDRETIQDRSESTTPLIDQLDESDLDAYRSALSSFPDLFKGK